jgi:Holliday junction resolvase - archaeal type
MAQKGESQLVRWTTDLLQKNHWWVYKIHGNQWSRNGIPDLVVIKGGVHVWIELKMPGNKPTKIQEYEMSQMREHGAKVIVAYSAMEALEGAERSLMYLAKV